MAEKGKSEVSSHVEVIRSPTPSAAKVASNVARIQRNVAEKQRRDKLNGYISELANIVPMVSMSSKRLDKTSILRLSAAHLRISKSVLGGNKKHKKTFKWCPSFLTSDQAREMLESVDGFLIVTTSTGKILFTSRSVERYLGHQDIEMIGHSLFIFVHPHDLDAVKDELEKLLLACLEDGTSRRCSFRCRIKEKAQPRSEVVTYQYVQFVGNMSACDEDNDGMASKSVVNHMFKAFVKLVDVSPYNQLSLEEATADEYVTRHSLDGTIIFADHRLATITGHMPHEVVGLSAYEYIHSGDTSIALFAHHLMFSNDKGTGMIVYRLRTRDERLVYLKSVGCLQYDKVTKQVDHFVCVNQQLSDTDGDSQLRYFVDRYIPHIKGSSASSLFESVKALKVPGTPGDEANKNGLVVPLNVPNVGVTEVQAEEGGTESVSKKSKCNDLNSENSCPNSPESQNSSRDGNIVNTENCSPLPVENKGRSLNGGSPENNERSSSVTDNYFDVSTDNSILYVMSDSSPLKGDVFHSDAAFPEMDTDSSFMIDKHLNDHACSSTKAGVQNGQLKNGDAMFSSVQFHHPSPQPGHAENGGAKTLNQPISPGSSNSCEIVAMYTDHDNPSPGVSFAKPHEDSNSSFEAEFPVCNGDPIIGDSSLDPNTKHSLFGNHHFSYGEESIHSKLSFSNSEDSVTFQANGSWRQKNSLKADFDPMEFCEESLPTPFEENGDIKKASSVLLGDLSSVLDSALPHDSHSLPCANNWNDIYSSTDCPSEDDSSQPAFL